MAVKFEMKIESGNDAFGICADASYELARLLKKVAQRLEEDGPELDLTLRDVNGNKCGYVVCEYTTEEEE